MLIYSTFTTDHEWFNLPEVELLVAADFICEVELADFGIGDGIWEGDWKRDTRGSAVPVGVDIDCETGFGTGRVGDSGDHCSSDGAGDGVGELNTKGGETGDSGGWDLVGEVTTRGGETGDPCGWNGGGDTGGSGEDKAGADADWTGSHTNFL